MKRVFEFGILLIAVIGFGVQLAAVGDSMAKYKKGTLNWVAEMEIDDADVPEPHLLASPFSVTEDADGNIYVVDTGAHNIKKFLRDGTFISAFGKKGRGPGDFRNPTNIAYVDGKLVIVDSSNRRLCVFSTTGNYLNSFKYNYIDRAVKVRPLGNKALTIEYETRNQDLNKGQRTVIKLTKGQELFTKQDIFYEQNIQRMKAIYEPIYTNIVLPFVPAVHWDSTPGGKLVIGFSDKYSIGVYDPIKGKIATISRDCQPVLVEEEDQKAFFSTIKMFRDGKIINHVPDYIRDNTKFPSNKPAFEAVLADNSGNILVFPFQKASDKKDLRKVDVFNIEGTFVRSVTLVGEINIYALSRGNGDYFWGLKRSKDEETSVVKYRLK